jgi:hypothetical protein
MWVSDRTPKQKLCMWCQEPFARAGYIHEPSTALNYCSPECVEIHKHLSEKLIVAYRSRVDSTARTQTGG